MSTEEKTGMLFLFFAVAFLLFVIGSNYNNSIKIRKAIENNCGQYNSETGDFEWIKREEK